MSTAGKLQQRKQPLQQRAENRVTQILAAYRRLLAAGEQRITTNRIASEAGIPVSSVYQYFPNKEAIAFAVYREWAEEALAVLRRQCAEAKHVKSLSELVNRPDANFFASVSGARIVHQLRSVVERSPELKRVQRKYLEAMAQMVAQLLRDLGSKWAERPLQNLVSLVLELNTTTFRHMARQDKASAADTFRYWQVAALALLEECIARPSETIGSR
ncbi:MAG: hypothetical protein JWO52_5717 [Gammaproteobacteria bacterium]|jgi:AcrR family transcriptional regulator|nr:hypothetical protein [Gammaproteobacteria bacterium]